MYSNFEDTIKEKGITECGIGEIGLSTGRSSYAQVNTVNRALNVRNSRSGSLLGYTYEM